MVFERKQCQNMAVWLISLPPVFLLTMCAYTYAHPCSLFKTDRKTTHRLIALHRKHVNRLFTSNEVQ